MSFFFRNRAVLCTLWHYEKLAWPQVYVAFVHADGDAALQNQKEVICVRVLMPVELTLDLDDHDVVAIERGDRSWLPVLTEGVELLREIDCLHGRSSK